MVQVNELACCGLRELQDIKDGNNDSRLRAIYSQLYANELGRNGPETKLGDCASIIFSQATRAKVPVNPAYGDKFAAFIRAQNLGTVTAVDAGKNPNSRHYIRTFIWEVNWTRLIEYCKAKGFSHYEPYNWY